MESHLPLSRRTFLTAGAAAVPALAAVATARSLTAKNGPIAIGSANGVDAATRAVGLMKSDATPVDAVVAGINLVEDDPKDQSVGYGGLPNERGVVELDAAVMDGPLHKAGAVGALRNIRNPSNVALRVMRRTDHVMLVGQGALEFAVAHGFKEEDLLTDEARERWLRWKEDLTPNDDWLNENQQVAQGPHIERDYGTIHLSGLDAKGNLGACTSTSGLSFKIPGRVGDSPIVGAGMFVDNNVGSAGSTGRGEAVIQSCGSFQVVRNMANGVSPTESCLQVLKWISDHTIRPDLLNKKGEPKFNVAFYALRKDGAYGSAVMHKGPSFAVHDGNKGRKEACAYLYE
jgi:N4-(beta-N-acetylglucosaminyl)-L-asparaginase